MPSVRSQGTLVDMEPAWWPTGSYGSLRMYDRYNYDYATMYRLQPNVRVCVEFLARNIAQLGLHVFRRVSETDRQRLRDHPLAQVLSRPLPNRYKMTRYRLIEALVGDLGVYWNAYWIKLRAADGELGLLRIPPMYMTVKGQLYPTGYEVNLGWTEPKKFTPDEVVHFRGYNPENPAFGLSPLETLRRVLAEEHAMGEYRENFWANSARMSGIISRPVEAPEWSPTARERFRQEFEELYSGKANSGKTAILEEGMSWEASSYNAQESEYLGGRKLTREECARSFHIPLPMVGILDHATFSNIKEQHKHLYQDSLGPWLAMIEQDIELQLLPDAGDTEGVYCEFNIQEKLAGSFEEQAESFQAAVGRPWMTANEARARQNLPSLDEGDELVTPLNVLVGGQASPRDSVPELRSAEPSPNPLPAGEGTKAIEGTKARGEVDPTLPKLRERHVEKWSEVMARHFRRQEKALIGFIPEKGRRKEMVDLNALWDGERWDRELQADMFAMSTATSTAWGRYVAEQMGIEFDDAALGEYLLESARVAAEQINASTRDHIDAALSEEEPRSAVRHLFELAISVRAPTIARSKVTRLSVVGSREAAKQSGLRYKVWQVNSSNPRSSHAAMDGERVPLGARFSNGMDGPGDYSGGGEEVANCQCSLGFSRG